MTRAIFKSACRCKSGQFWPPIGGRAGQRHRHRVGEAGCVGGAGGKRRAAGECELCGQEQSAAELSGIGAGGSGKLKVPNTVDEEV